MDKSNNSDLIPVNLLAHFGTKGMRWGVRQAEPGASRAEKKVIKADTKWAKKALTPANSVEVHNKAANAMNNHHIDRLNNKPEYKDKDLSIPSTLQTKYYKEYADVFSSEISKAGASLGLSASGKYKVETWLEDGQMLPTMRVVEVEAKHAAGDTIIVELKRDSSGHIISMKIPTTTISQSASFDEVLAHFGTKGMRWGVRTKDGSTSSGPTDVIIKDGRAGKKLKTTGGKRQPASEDAKVVAVSKRMAFKSSTDSLSTKQLQEMVNRMNLEQQYSRLETDSFASKSGAKFASKMIKQHGKDAAVGAFKVGVLAKNDPRTVIASKLASAFKQVAMQPRVNKKKKK